MPWYFQTDRSGNTAHTEAPRGLLVVALCGVTNENTQWTRSMTAIGPDERDCPRCRARRRKGR